MNSTSDSALSSANVSERLLAAIDSARSKMQAEMKDSQLRTAMYALVTATQDESLQKQRVQKMEDVVLSSARKIATDNDEDLLSTLLKWLHFAEIAYEGDTEVLTHKLRTHGYELHTHKTTVEAADVGYYVALNHSTKQLLIGVKGTSSLADAITDCVAVTMPHVCKPCPYTGNNQEREIRCHEGILKAALKLCRDIYQDIVEKQAIQRSYTIIISGHSLGAGTASLLGILLRALGSPVLREPGYLQVYAFACPPVCDSQSAQESTPFITSIVNKSDVVPRCSIANVEITTNLLNELAKMMKESDHGKSGISGSKGIIKVKSLESKRNEGEVHPLSPDLLGQFLQKSQEQVPVDHPDHLYVPGRVVLFYDHSAGEEDDVQTRACITDGSHKVLRMIDFNGMNTISDHYCDSYFNSFRALGVTASDWVSEAADSNQQHSSGFEFLCCGGGAD